MNRRGVHLMKVGDVCFIRVQRGECAPGRPIRPMKNRGKPKPPLPRSVDTHPSDSDPIPAKRSGVSLKVAGAMFLE
jgi:hypothetical protein